ncbi:MAG: F0F1 ATP synthase subunit B [Oscillospiraceae bacterium]|nr:F0F1 ATP synthase subunit B [Oscillospiraceae bacterium]
MFESFIGINPWTALFTLLNFLLLFFVAKKFLFVPVKNMIKERQQEIDDQYARAEEAEANARELQCEYEKKLSQAAETGEKLVQEAMARGKSREEEILRQAHAQADAMIEKASGQIAQQKKKALNEAKDEISVIAMDIATKVVGRTIDENDQARLVDSFIENLGESHE